MTCKDAQQRWHRRLDRGGPDAELDAHLAACESCRTNASRMERLVALLDELREDTEIMASPAAEVVLQRKAGHRRGWMSPSARSLLRIAAAILVTVGVGLWYGMETSPTALVRRTMSAPPAAGITLRAKSQDRFIAIAVPSDEPNVQTFWLYPSVTVTESRNGS